MLQGPQKSVTPEGFVRAGGASAHVLCRVGVITIRAKAACTGKDLSIQV